MTRETPAEQTSFDPQVVRLIHDMRNELASVRGATHMLSRSPADQEIVARVIEGLQQHVTHMATLMDDFVGHSAVQPQAAPASDVATDSLSLLVADDNVDAANTLATYLRMQGHQVVVAFDGESAWQLARDDHPNVMLLDISMPSLDGYELAKRVRAQPWGGNIRLIAISGWLSPEQRARALASGYDAQVNKPIDTDALETLLRSAAANDCQPS